MDALRLLFRHHGSAGGACADDRGLPAYCVEHITSPSAAHPACAIWLATACVRV